MNDTPSKAKKARSGLTFQATFNPPKPALGLLARARGKFPKGHTMPGATPAMKKAIQARQKMTLTSLVH